MTLVEKIVEQLCQNRKPVHFVAGNPALNPRADQVIYLEENYSEPVNAYIQKNIERLKNLLSIFGIELVYMPVIRLSDEEKAYWQVRDDEAGSSLTTKVLYESLQPKKVEGKLPALLFFDQKCGDESHFYGIPLNEENIEESLYQLFTPPTRNYSMNSARFSRFEAPATCCTIATNYDEDERFDDSCEDFDEAQAIDYVDENICLAKEDACYNIAPRTIDDLTDEDRATIAEIETKLTLLRRNGVSDSILGSIFVHEVKPSTLVVTSDYRITIPDFGLEVNMTSIDKVLYLLLLRHPEGILQKCLTDYVKEMKQIYMAMNDGFLPDRYAFAIEALAYNDGSCNQHISRIRKAFKAQAGDNVTDQYVPSSGRGALRRIPLDANLVKWEDKI